MQRTSVVFRSMFIPYWIRIKAFFSLYFSKNFYNMFYDIYKFLMRGAQ